MNRTPHKRRARTAPTGGLDGPGPVKAAAKSRRALDVWLSTALSAVTPTNPVHIHLDELVDDPRHAHSLSMAIELWLMMVDILKPRLGELSAELMLPIGGETRRLRTGAPSWDSIRRLVTRQDEPPALYLIDRRGWMLWSTDEEYRIPIAVPPSLPDGTKACYSSRRSADAVRDNWEYGRCVFVQWYPRELLPA